MFVSAPTPLFLPDISPSRGEISQPSVDFANRQHFKTSVAVEAADLPP